MGFYTMSAKWHSSKKIGTRMFINDTFRDCMSYSILLKYKDMSTELKDMVMLKRIQCLLGQLARLNSLIFLQQLLTTTANYVL